jgi:ABC-2 type transport system ATP-binding protein
VAIIEHGRIIDVDSPERLVSRNCPQRTVVLTTDDPKAEAHFARVPHVTAVARQGARYTIDGLGDEFVTEVIQCVSQNAMHVSDFRTVLPTLEDVFLKLTGRSIRD